MYQVMVYDRKTDNEMRLSETETSQEAKRQVNSLKRFTMLFVDESEDLFENVYFYVQDENGCSVY